MAQAHRYQARLEWVGAARGRTVSYQSYAREYSVAVPGKPGFTASADPTFRGDPKLYNPEDMLVIALAACHMLSYLWLCSRARLPVVTYVDEATGTMDLLDGKTRFVEVVLHPRVTIEPGADLDLARRLHEGAHGECFIANSVNFPVRHEPQIAFAG